MKSDPTDNGGMFIGRRPGTQKPHYRSPGERRLRRDKLLSLLIAALMAILALSMVSLLPVGSLYLVAHVPPLAQRPFLALSVAFAVIMLSAMGILAIEARLERWWVLVRRASGVDQRKGIMAALIGGAVFLAGAGFTLFLIFGGGLASTPMGPQLP